MKTFVIKSSLFSILRVIYLPLYGFSYFGQMVIAGISISFIDFTATEVVSFCSSNFCQQLKPFSSKNPPQTMKPIKLIQEKFKHFFQNKFISITKIIQITTNHLAQKIRQSSSQRRKQTNPEEQNPRTYSFVPMALFCWAKTSFHSYLVFYQLLETFEVFSLNYFPFNIEYCSTTP